MSVVDLQSVRLATLERVHEAIYNLEIVLKNSSGSPNEYLVRGLLKTLRKNEAVLQAGILPRRVRSK